MWTIVDNPDGDLINVPNKLTTDVRFLVARRTAGIPGNRSYLWVSDAKKAYIAGGTGLPTIDDNWGTMTNPEYNGY